LAIAALINDPHRNGKVQVAENLLRRLKKVGSEGEKFRTKAAEVYKYGTYFTA
jgi:hypothetical protein